MGQLNQRPLRRTLRVMGAQAGASTDRPGSGHGSRKKVSPCALSKSFGAHDLRDQLEFSAGCIVVVV